jgi:hypothetical protein
VANRIVRPLLANWRIVAQNERRASTSIATVGSSSTSRSGSLTSATAKRTRWVSPPESFSVRCSAKALTPVSDSTSSSAIGAGYNDAIIVISTRTRTLRMRPPVCSIAPTAPASTAFRGGRPKTLTLPASGASRPSSMSIVVDLPAPLGPSSATVSPARIDTSMPRTASIGPFGPANVFATPRSCTSAESRCGRTPISVC